MDGYSPLRSPTTGAARWRSNPTARSSSSQPRAGSSRHGDTSPLVTSIRPSATTVSEPSKPDMRRRVVQDLVLQPDGKIVLGGQMARKAMVARLMPDGSLDTSFGDGDGLATIVPAVRRTTLAAVRVLLFPDGGILAEVNRSSRFRSRSFLIRFSPRGSADPAFARAGRLPVGKWVPAISLGGAGILSARSDPASTHRVAVTRYSLNGSLDEGFGSRRNRECFARSGRL